MESVCEWEISYNGCEGEPNLGENKEFFENIATSYLWNWTNQQFGLCEETVRPCRQDCGRNATSTFGGSRAPFAPVLMDGRWLNIGCGFCGDTCGCNMLHAITVPGPVAEVTTVKIDGASVTDYKVQGNTLYRNDPWPMCQNMMEPDTAPGTYSITYKRGLAVPEGGQMAAGILAEEFSKAACGDKTCQLPKRLQSITRQDVTMAMLDTFDDIEKGHTGIWIVDSWIASVTKTKQRSRVYSPDIQKRRFLA